ncbi:MAG TPA: DinB family protein [Candidatus Acidoferrum sp.]|nr:DinB family protein [Candidatus Acidoferrum sp.]
MIGLPERAEAAPYYFTYVDRITNPDVVDELKTQLEDFPKFLQAISEQKSLHRYAPDKWSIRQTIGHINDAERVFAFRAFWFARTFETPLPSFDQNIAVNAANADLYSWTSHIGDFVAVRSATISLFRNLPAEAWLRKGIASENTFTVRALAYVIAGHLVHHRSILETRYLQPQARSAS